MYFVASGDLLSQAEREALEGEGRAVPLAGADNLYVYDRTSGSVAFIGDLCLGPQRSGTVEDLRCPTKAATDKELWAGGGGEAQTADADGRFLVFSTYAQLAANDTDAAGDVYRYDAESGALDRVSLGEAGHDANGNNSAFDVTIAHGNVGGSVRFQQELDSRAISEDGSRVVFTTAEPLSSAAANALVNVYEWHKQPGAGEGSVSLISGGSAEQPVIDVVISPDGRNIFFSTVQGLVPQDTDGAPDIYDARAEGGFPPVPPERRPCEGDACQGPLTNPAPLLVPGSVLQAPGENLATPSSPQTVNTKKKGKPKKKCKRGYKHNRRGRCVKARKKGRASVHSIKAASATGRSER